jgi:hypothetical protein
MRISVCLELLSRGAHSGVLDIARAFNNAGLSQIVTDGEAAEPGTQPAESSSPAEPPQLVTPSSSMTLTIPFQRPRVRLKRAKGRLVLMLSGRPREAQAQVRYLGHPAHSRHLRVLRTLYGSFTDVKLPVTGIVEVSVRYTDPYDQERASPWTTLKLPLTPVKNAMRESHR